MWSIIFKSFFVFACVAFAAQPVIKDYSDPSNPVSQFRLAYNGPTGMTVSWSSNNQTFRPTVWYGENPNFLDQSAVGTSTTFQSSIVWDNHVVINNLRPFTKYYYKINNDDGFPFDFFQKAQDDFYFYTSREEGDRSSFTIAFFADLGIVVGSGSTATVPDTFNSVLSQRDSYEFVWHSGDFGYADQWQSEEQSGTIPSDLPEETAYNNIMNSYYDQFINVTKNTAYMVGPGNHEAQCIEPNPNNICPPGQLNFTGYRNHFNMPTQSQTKNFEQNMWYSFNYGMVHFVQLNTETDLGPNILAPDAPGGDGGYVSGPFGFPNQQIEWLEADLASVDRSVTPWVIVSGHRPWYTAASGSLCTQCGQAFESILLEHNVDLVWFGHVHYYERDAPVANGTVDPAGLENPKAPLYLVVGCGGNYEGHSTPDSTLPDYTVVVNDQDYGWSKLTFHNSSYLTSEFISSETNEVLDEVTLFKDHKVFGCHW